MVNVLVKPFMEKQEFVSREEISGLCAKDNFQAKRACWWNFESLIGNLLGKKSHFNIKDRPPKLLKMWFGMKNQCESGFVINVKCCLFFFLMKSRCSH